MVQVGVVCMALGAPVALKADGDADKGKALFEEKCSVCHNADSEEKNAIPPRIMTRYFALMGKIIRIMIRSGKSMPNASRIPKIAPDAPTVG